MNEKKIFLKSWNEDFESQFIDMGYPNEKPISIAVVHKRYTLLDLLFVVGTHDGRVLLYDSAASWSTSSTYWKEPTEGPVSRVMAFEDLLIWSNRQHVYIKNYTREEAIVQIARPDSNPLLPYYLYKPNMTPPTFSIKIDRSKKGTLDKPVYFLVCAWFNSVRRFRIAYDNKKMKY